MSLTKHQEEIWNNLLSSESVAVAMLGSAGVGKSYSTVEKIKKLLEAGNTIAVTGSSHRAVANLKEMGLPIQIEPRTIHSFTGMIMRYVGNKTTLKKKPSHKQDEVDYLFVDELSMLTSPIIREIDSLIEDGTIKKKIILIGDMVQLMLESGDPLLGVETFELTEQMRQVPDKAFINNFKILRDMIADKPKQGKFIYNDKFIMTKDHKEFIKLYCEDNGDKLILCSENFTVKTYNSHIQKDLFELNHYNEGDMIQPTEPIMNEVGNMIIYNREVVKIEKINRKRLLRVPKEIQENTLEVTIKGYPVLIITGKTNVKNYLNELADQKAWQEMYKLKEQMAEFHHMYSSTVHSAQGLSVSTAYVDLQDIKKMKARSKNQYLRAFYVACSRAKSKVVIFDGQDKKYDEFKKYKAKK